ncbi:hypothetical protein CAQUA_10540 [Corynebacterium aquatimens]|nr:hypothetical protein CAQUA_10540 [Corynebacterium aquatimens]
MTNPENSAIENAAKKNLLANGEACTCGESAGQCTCGHHKTCDCAPGECKCGHHAGEQHGGEQHGGEQHGEEQHKGCGCS